ncbi:MAG: amidohydrolase family protein [Bacteroidota bacterium]
MIAELRLRLLTMRETLLHFMGYLFMMRWRRCKILGIPASDLIVMATKNGAMTMNRLDDFGTLEKGEMADLIILEINPSEDIANIRSITNVMRGGKLKPVDKKFEIIADSIVHTNDKRSFYVPKGFFHVK